MFCAQYNIYITCDCFRKLQFLKLWTIKSIYNLFPLKRKLLFNPTQKLLQFDLRQIFRNNYLFLD